MTFKDLEWLPHPAGVGGEMAKVSFGNGFGASVLRGGMFYTTGGTYEIGVLHNGKLHYENPVANGDVLAYLSEQEVNTALAAIEALAPIT